MLRFGRKQGITQSLDQRAFSMAISAGNAIDSFLKIDRDAIGVGAFSIGLDVFDAKRAYNHSKPNSLVRLAPLPAGPSCRIPWRLIPLFPSTCPVHLAFPLVPGLPTTSEPAPAAGFEKFFPRDLRRSCRRGQPL